MRRTLTLPDGRQLVTTSTKRWHVVSVRADDPIRIVSCVTRERALAAWRTWTRDRPAYPYWLIDIETGDIVREPPSRERSASARLDSALIRRAARGRGDRETGYPGGGAT